MPAIEGTLRKFRQYPACEYMQVRRGLILAADFSELIRTVRRLKTGATGTMMFFAVKCAFWMSVVALAMPGGEVEARRAGALAHSLAAIAVPVAVAAMSAGHAAAAPASQCLAAEKCRAALTMLIKRSLAEDYITSEPAPTAPVRSKPARQRTAATVRAAEAS